MKSARRIWRATLHRHWLALANQSSVREDRMRQVRTSAVLLLFVAASARAQSAPHANTAAAISAADVKARIGYLASDAMKGRDTPSPGLEAAAAYIANEFKSLGLQPAGDSGTFIQRW